MGWQKLSAEAIRPSAGADILVVRDDGVGYCGRIVTVHEHCVVLKNNGFSQDIFFDKKWWFQFVDLPKTGIPKMGDGGLPLGDK